VTSKTTTKTLFDWLEEITVKKTPPGDFSEESWDSFNSYMVHRYLSMDINYLELVNYVQKISPQNKKQIYTIYREMIPKKKVWLKYIKPSKKQRPQNIVEYVAKYYECSLGEADYYIDIIQEHGVRNILWQMGIDQKEQDKLVKTL
jgi:hypothetical protein